MNSSDLDLKNARVGAHRLRWICALDAVDVAQTTLLPAQDWMAGTARWVAVSAREAMGVDSGDGAEKKLSISALRAWGAWPEGIRTEVFELRAERASGPWRLDLQLSERARQRLAAFGLGRSGFAIGIRAVHLRRFASAVAHLELDFALSEPTDLTIAELTEALFAFEQALFTPERADALRAHGEPFCEVLAKLKLAPNETLRFLHSRAYSMAGVKLSQELPDADWRTWTHHLAHRHTVQYRMGDKALARVLAPFAGMRERIASEGAAILLEAQSKESHYLLDFFENTWPLTVRVPIAIALHERQLLQRLSDGTTAPESGREIEDEHVEALARLRDTLVRYRLDYRVVEISMLEHVQERFEAARLAFKLDSALSCVEADLEAGYAQLQAAVNARNERRWAWSSAVVTGSGAFWAMNQFGELYLKNRYGDAITELVESTSLDHEAKAEYQRLNGKMAWESNLLMLVAFGIALISAALIFKSRRA